MTLIMREVVFVANTQIYSIYFQEKLTILISTADGIKGVLRVGSEKIGQTVYINYSATKTFDEGKIEFVLVILS